MKPVVITGSGFVAWMSAHIILTRTQAPVYLIEQAYQDAPMYVALTPRRLAWLRQYLPCHDKDWGVFQTMYIAGPSRQFDIPQTNKPLAYLVDLNQLTQTLRQSLQNHPKLEIGQETISAITQNTLTCGQIIEYSALLIAEGSQSPTRDLIWPSVTQDPTYVDFQSYATLTPLSTELPHNGRSYQYFDERGIYAYLPQRDPHQSIFITHHVEPDQHDYDPKPFGSHHSPQSTSRFPLSTMHISPCVKHQVVLLGDARSRIHPLAGLGLNTGLYCLEVLDKTLKTMPLSPFLWQEYEALTDPQVAKAYMLTKHIAQLSQSHTGRSVIDTCLGLAEFWQQDDWLREQADPAIA